MSVQAQYPKKRGTAQDAIDQVKNGDFIIVPTGVGEPPTLQIDLLGQEMTSIAHPDFRAELTEAAQQMHIL